MDSSPVVLPEGDARDVCFIPGSGRSLGVESGNPLQYSFLENSMDRGAWGATVYGVAEPDLTKHARMRARAHTHTHTHTHTHYMFTESNSFNCHSKMAAYQ